MKFCVPYYFAYVQKRPAPGETPRSIAAQIEVAGIFGKTQNYRAIKQFRCVLTNRDRHFAETLEFREAVQYATESDASLLFADLQSLLASTHPDQISGVLTAMAESGVPLFNATTGGALKSDDLERMVVTASRISSRRRVGIKEALNRSSSARQSVNTNQPKAARGAALAAQRNAERLRPIVESILAAQPEGTVLTPTVLVRALNARSVPTTRGGVWYVSGAKNLLARLDQ